VRMGSTDHDNSPHPHRRPSLEGEGACVCAQSSLAHREVRWKWTRGNISPLAPGEGGAKRRVREATFVGRHD